VVVGLVLLEDLLERGGDAGQLQPCEGGGGRVIGGLGSLDDPGQVLV
jgi:hypothetical protein